LAGFATRTAERSVIISFPNLCLGVCIISKDLKDTVINQGKFAYEVKNLLERKSILVTVVCELMGGVRKVVLMNVYLDLGNPGGSGLWVKGYMSQVREMGKLVYEQPGNEVDGSCHSKEGSK
jgi:hypothetical protein